RDVMLVDGALIVRVELELFAGEDLKALVVPGRVKDLDVRGVVREPVLTVLRAHRSLQAHRREIAGAVDPHLLAIALQMLVALRSKTGHTERQRETHDRKSHKIPSPMAFRVSSEGGVVNAPDFI